MNNILHRLVTGLLFALLATIPAKASSWVGLYGDYGFNSPTAMTATSDGGFILAVYTESFGYGAEDRPDVLLLKLDGYGTIQWQEVIGTPIHTDKALSIIEAEDGRFVFAGITYNATSGYAEAWVVAVAPTGEVLWQKAYEGQIACYARSIAECSDGGFILCGTWWDPYHQFYHPWAMRLDSEGNILWERAFGKSDFNYGAVRGDWLSVLPDADGGCFVWGYYVDLRPQPELGGLQLVKLDAAGNIEWQKLYQGIAASNVVRAPDGGFALAGYGSNITRLDAQGNVLWNMAFDKSTLPAEASLWGIAANPDGGYLVMGNRNYDGSQWLVGISEAGVVERERLYRPARSFPVFHALCGAPDGGAAVAFFSATPGLPIGILKTQADFTLEDPCISATPVQTVWTTPSVALAGPADLDPIDLEPAYSDATARLKATAANEEHTFCPYIQKVRKLQYPFRLELLGGNFQEKDTDNNYWWDVTIDGVSVPKFNPKSRKRMVLQGGKDLKAMLPKGQPVCIRIISINPYDPLSNSVCYTYTR